MPPRAPGSARKKGGGVDKRAPRRSERERGRESADRRVLPRSERGKGEARGLSAPLGRVRVAGGGGVLGRQRPKASGERGFKPVQGLGLGQNR